MSGAGDQRLRDSAKKARQMEIRYLRACVCAYPLTRYRNGSGHADDCPTHALWTKEHDG